VRSLHAYGLGRETAEKLAEEEGTMDEYQKAVRKVRLVQRLAGRPEKGCAGSGPLPACGRGRQVGLPGLTRASAYCVGVPIMSLSPVRRGRALAQAHSSEQLRTFGLCSRACDGVALWVETLALSERVAPHGRRVARPLSGAASGDWRVTGMVLCAGCALEGLWTAGEDGGALGDCGAACMRTARLC
jgi:hypothetical protein